MMKPQTDTPTFSVVLPTYNRKDRLCRAVDSVLRQTYGGWELIIVDDGSADGTESVVRGRYGREIGNGTVRYLRIGHAGVCRARNEALRLAENEWIAYLDSDNELRADALSRFAEAIVSHPERKAFYGCMRRLGDGKKVGRPFDYELLLRGNYIDLGTYVHHRSLAESAGGFDEAMTRFVDWDFVTRCSVSYPPLFIGHCVMDYDDGPRSDRITLREDYDANVSRYYDKLVARGECPVEVLVGEGVTITEAARTELVSAMREAKADFAYADEFGSDPSGPSAPPCILKPDFDPELLLATNYIGPVFAVRFDLLLRSVRALPPRPDAVAMHDLALRLTERSRKVLHVRKPLYRTTRDVVAAAPADRAEDCRRIVADALARRGIAAEVVSADNAFPSVSRVRYALPLKEKVSVIIPTRDHVDDLRKCLGSVFGRTGYPDYEVIVVDNGSTDPGALAYLADIGRRKDVRIVRSDSRFNFSRLVNLGAAAATGGYLLLLNNDTEVLSPDWMEEMVSFARRPEIGAVGVKLYYPDGTIQHGGVILGMGGVAHHAFIGRVQDGPGPLGRLAVAHEYCAVTAACMMVRREVFDRVGGFCPVLAVAFNDVDFCLRLRVLGYHNVWTPFAELRHYESKSRGRDDDPESAARLREEIGFFRRRWRREIEEGDPFYHPLYDLRGESFVIRDPGESPELPIPSVRSYWHKRLPFPLDKFFGGIYCLLDHGIVYTWRRFWRQVRGGEESR